MRYVCLFAIAAQADAAAHSGIEALYKDFKPILNKNGELTSRCVTHTQHRDCP